MIEPQSEQILQAAAARVATMTGTRPWGGPYPNPVVVERQYRAPDLVAQTPHVAVLAASGATARILSINPQHNVEHLFPVVFYATVAPTAGLLIDTWLQLLRDDLLTTMLGAATLGGLTSGIADVVTFEADEGEFEPRGQLAMTMTYKYRESKEVA